MLKLIAFVPFPVVHTCLRNLSHCYLFGCVGKFHVSSNCIPHHMPCHIWSKHMNSNVSSNVHSCWMTCHISCTQMVSLLCESCDDSPKDSSAYIPSHVSCTNWLLSLVGHSWFISRKLLLNDLSHFSHSYGFSPMWFLSRLFKHIEWPATPVAHIWFLCSVGPLTHLILSQSHFESSPMVVGGILTLYSTVLLCGS